LAKQIQIAITKLFAQKKIAFFLTAPQSTSVATSRLDYSATPDAFSSTKLTLPSSSPSLTSTKKGRSRLSAGTYVTATG